MTHAHQFRATALRHRRLSAGLCRLCALLITLLLSGVAPVSFLYAQDGDESAPLLDVWGAPVNVSQTRTSVSRYPDLAVDRMGRLHLTWVEHPQIDEQGLKDPEEGADFTVQESLLMYSTLESDGWSLPFDLAYNPIGELLIPSIANDSMGKVHIVFWDKGAHYHIVSQPNAVADSAVLWSAPINITQAIRGIQNRFPNLLIDSEDKLHLAYVENSDQRQDDGNAGGIRYTSSTNAGSNWELSTFVDDYPGWPILGATSYDSNFARSEDGTLHFISMDGDEVTYIQSEPNGIITRREIIETADDRRAYVSGWVYLENDRIHLLWGTQKGNLYHKWSADGGDSWSGANQLAAQEMRRYGGIGIAADSQGRLVVAYSDRGDIWSQIWDGTRWSGANNLTNTPNQFDLWPRMVIANGNEAHLVWYAGFPEVFLYDAVNRMGRGEYEILHATALLDAPRLEPIPYAGVDTPISPATPGTEMGDIDQGLTDESGGEPTPAESVVTEQTTSVGPATPADNGTITGTAPPTTVSFDPSSGATLGQLQQITGSPQGVLVMSTGVVLLLLVVVIGINTFRQ